MKKDETLEFSTEEEAWFISIKPCEKERDGRFIRELTRENFYTSFVKTVGWNEKRHCEQPKFPKRYRMLFVEDTCIGFLSLREQADCLYLETLQLIKQFRGRGIGTALMQFIERVARERGKGKLQLRVFKDNPAQALYRRAGFSIIENQERSLLMEKRVSTFGRD